MLKLFYFIKLLNLFLLLNLLFVLKSFIFFLNSIFLLLFIFYGTFFILLSLFFFCFFLYIYFVFEYLVLVLIPLVIVDSSSPSIEIISVVELLVRSSSISKSSIWDWGLIPRSGWISWKIGFFNINWVCCELRLLEGKWVSCVGIIIHKPSWYHIEIRGVSLSGVWFVSFVIVSGFFFNWLYSAVGSAV